MLCLIRRHILHIVVVHHFPPTHKVCSRFSPDSELSKKPLKHVRYICVVNAVQSSVDHSRRSEAGEQLEDAGEAVQPQQETLVRTRVLHLCRYYVDIV